MLSVTSNPRVSFYDREPVIEHLKRAYVEGRLDDAELDLRVGRALTVTTMLELESLVSDLPWPSLRPAARRARRLRFTVLIVISATVGTAVTTCYWAMLITAGMSLHLVR